MSSTAVARRTSDQDSHAQLPYETVWRLLLQHAWQPPDQQVICRLLSTAKAIRSVVHDVCRSRLCVTVKQARNSSDQQQDLKQFSKWLAKHQQLVQQLVLDRSPAAKTGTDTLSGSQSPSIKRVSSKLAALQLQLKRLTLSGPQPAVYVPPIPTSAISSPFSTLIRLEWVVSSSCKSQRVAKALQQLHALQHLSLTCLDSGSGQARFEDIAPAVRDLGALTSLQLKYFSISKASTQLFPPSLQALSLGPPLPRLYARAMREQHLQLQHMTALQDLHLHCLKGCDVLPAGLQSLQVAHCSVLPLLLLKRLRVLSIAADAPESVLGQLSVLQSLEELHLTYKTGCALSAAGVGHLRSLPLVSLRCIMPAQQLQVLGQIGGRLTQLQLQMERDQLTRQTSLGELLAQQLPHLAALQALCVHVGTMASSACAAAQPGSAQQVNMPALPVQAEPSSSGAAVQSLSGEAPFPGISMLAAALCSMPALTSLELHGLSLHPAAAAQLMVAAQFTRLLLPTAGYEDAAAATPDAATAAAMADESAGVDAVHKAGQGSRPVSAHVMAVMVHHD